MKQFDLKTIFHIGRPLSWSSISQFEYRPSDWYKKYVLGELPLITPELEFGKMIDEKVQKDPTFLPELVRYPIQQHEMRTVWNGIPLIGYSDQYSQSPLAIRDLKTGRKAWDQKRANATGQLTMYLFMLYLMDKKIKVADAELYIDWIPTHLHEGKIVAIEPLSIKTFKTKRSMQQVLEFAQRIERVWAEMEDYARRQVESVVHDRSNW